jgi:hypothetical protein
VSDVNGIVVELPHVELSLETWKLVLGAVIVIFPGAPYNNTPETLMNLDVEKAPTIVLGNAVIVLEDKVGTEITGCNLLFPFILAPSPGLT